MTTNEFNISNISTRANIQNSNAKKTKDIEIEFSELLAQGFQNLFNNGQIASPDQSNEGFSSFFKEKSIDRGFDNIESSGADQRGDRLAGRDKFHQPRQRDYDDRISTRESISSNQNVKSNDSSRAADQIREERNGPSSPKYDQNQNEKTSSRSNQSEINNFLVNKQMNSSENIDVSKLLQNGNSIELNQENAVSQTADDILKQLRDAGLVQLTGTREKSGIVSGNQTNNDLMNNMKLTDLAKQSLGEQNSFQENTNSHLKILETAINGKLNLSNNNGMLDAGIKNGQLQNITSGDQNISFNDLNLDGENISTQTKSTLKGEMQQWFQTNFGIQSASQAMKSGVNTTIQSGQNINLDSNTLNPLQGTQRDQLLVQKQALPPEQMKQNAARAVQTLASEMSKNVKAGESKFEIRLDPAELGRVDIRMRFSDDGVVKAQLIVEKPETLDMLMRDQRSLEKLLEQTGLKTDSAGLQFSLKDQNQNSFSQMFQDQTKQEQQAKQEQVVDDGSVEEENINSHNITSSALNMIV